MISFKRIEKKSRRQLMKLKVILELGKKKFSIRTGKNIKTYDRVSKECFSVAMYEEPRTHAILQNGNCLVAHKQYYFFELFNIYEQHTDQVGWARNSMIADNKNFYGDQAMEFLDIGQERFLIRSNYGSKDGNILYLADYSGEYIDSYKFDNYISGMLQLSEFTVVAWSKNVLYLWNISNNNKFELSQVNSITNVCKVSESIILTFDNNKVLTCWDIDKKEILFNFSKFVRKIIDIVPSTADIVYLVNDLRVIYELSVSKQKILRSIVVPSMVSASMNIRENKIIVHENASIAQYQI